MDIQNENDMELIYKEGNKSIEETEKMIAKELDKVSKFTYDNFDELLKIIFEHCSDISDIDEVIKFLNKNLNKIQNRREVLSNLKGITRREIISNNLTKNSEEFLHFYKVSGGMNSAYFLHINY